MKNGIIIVLSGFSGAGKGSVVNKLLNDFDNYVVSVSATTRDRRPGEENGKSYFFLSREEFENKIKNNDFIEYAKYVNNYYGTPREYVLNMLSSGKNVILEIECQGALKVKEQFEDSVLIFLTTPTVKDIEKRLKGRGTETDEQIKNRIHRAFEEVDYIREYDYLVINDDLDETANCIHSIVKSEHNRISRQDILLNNIKNEFCEMMKGE